MESNYHAAEPGLILWTAMSKYSPSNYVGRPIACTNPCAEVPLEEGGACNLGSINLSRFVIDGYTDRARVDWDALWEVTQYAVRFLDNVVYWNEKLNPLEKQRRAASETRRLGLGVMGIADMLNQLGKMYDSDEAVALMEKVMETLTNAAYQSSALIAAEKGASPIFTYDNYARCPFFQEALSDETRALIKKHGIRNIAIMSIAPTGSISNIVLGFQHKGKNYIGVSGGVEPVFALFYSRRSESFGNQIFRVFHSTVYAYLEMHKLCRRCTEEAARGTPPGTLLPYGPCDRAGYARAGAGDVSEVCGPFDLVHGEPRRGRRARSDLAHLSPGVEEGSEGHHDLSRWQPVSDPERGRQEHAVPGDEEQEILAPHPACRWGSGEGACAGSVGR